MPSRRVVVTGIGVLSGFGSGRAAFEAGLFEGRSAIRPIAGFDAAAFACRSGAELPDFDPRALVRKAELHQFDRVSLMAMAAADAALADAGLDTTAIGPVAGVAMGTGFGPAQAIEESVLRVAAGQRLRPTTIVKMMLNSPAAALVWRFGLTRGSSAHVTACAASAHAIAEGMRAVRDGEMEICLAGGADAFPPRALFAAWDALGVMHETRGGEGVPMRPFAAERDGFVIGEAAALLVLESAAHAKARGATILAEIAGAGSASDAPSLTKPSLAGMVGAMRAALRDAGLAPEDVGHVNAHGTATELNDALEAEAIREVCGTGRPSVTASKAALGHCMGAGSAVEAASTCLALYRGLAPPVAGLDRADPALGLDVVTGSARPMAAQAALSNSFAFGGHYVSLAFRRAAP